MLPPKTYCRFGIYIENYIYKKIHVITDPLPKFLKNDIGSIFTKR